MLQVKSGRCALPFALVTFVALWAQGAEPQPEQFFPAGGQVGQTVELDVVGKVDPWPPKIWANRAGVELSATDKKGKLTAKIAADAPTGAYWFRLFNAEGASSLVPFLVGHVPEVVEQEPNDDPTKPQAVSGDPIIVNARLQKRGDVDHFAVTLPQGAVLVAAVDSQRSLGSPLDATLQITSADGFVLSHNDDGPNFDPLIVFTAPQAGTYVVRVFGFPVATDQSIALSGGPAWIYRLTLTTKGFLDYTLPLAVERNSSTRLELFGWNVPTELSQLDASVPGEGKFELSDSRLANQQSLPIEAHHSLREQEPNDRASAPVLAVPLTQTGQIAQPGDDDCLRFAAKAGEKFVLTVESRALGYPLDPVLEVLDAQGKSLARGDDVGENRDAVLEFAAPADGEYLVSVTDLHRSGTPRHVYRLTILRGEPDYKLTLAADRFAVACGATLEIPVTVERLHGFNQPISIVATGLPAGTTCEPVVSPAEGDSAKAVKLSVKAGAEPYSGVIRVAGRVGGAEAEHVATAAVTGKPISIAEIWLTLTPEKK